MFKLQYEAANPSKSQDEGAQDAFGPVYLSDEILSDSDKRTYNNYFVDQTDLSVGCGYNAITSSYISPEYMMTSNPMIELSPRDVSENRHQKYGQSTIITKNK